MADFSKPEYTSYVALCRELSVPITLDQDGYPQLHGSAQILNERDEIVTVDWQQEHSSLSSPTWIWLPSLSDWLEMLEAGGISQVGFIDYRSIGHGWSIGSLYEYENVHGMTHWAVRDDASSPTREEAAARLWMEVVAGA